MFVLVVGRSSSVDRETTLTSQPIQRALCLHTASRDPEGTTDSLHSGESEQESFIEVAASSFLLAEVGQLQQLHCQRE